MAGDVNLFTKTDQEEGVFELDVMVAEKRSRQKGIAEEAL